MQFVEEREENNTTINDSSQHQDLCFPPATCKKVYFRHLKVYTQFRKSRNSTALVYFPFCLSKKAFQNGRGCPRYSLAERKIILFHVNTYLLNFLQAQLFFRNPLSIAAHYTSYANCLLILDQTCIKELRHIATTPPSVNARFHFLSSDCEA